MATDTQVVQEVAKETLPDNARPASRDFSLKEIEQLEARLLPLPQIDVPLKHDFAPNVYLREVTMPADSFIIGHEHKTEHFNVILTGRASVLMDGVVHEIVAPTIIKSGAGVRKILYIHETMRWATIHPTNETDIQKLEEMLVIPSDSYKNYHAMKEIEQLRQHLIEGGASK